MTSPAKQLYLFLAACGGNWRNTIYISRRRETDISGYLMAADRDGQPVFMPVQRFYELTGEQIDPAECCGQLTEVGFEAMYASYLVWHCSSAEEQPLMAFFENSSGSD